MQLIKKRSVTQNPGWERNSPGKMNISCFLLFIGGQVIKMTKLCNAVFIQTKVDLLKIFKANVLLLYKERCSHNIFYKWFKNHFDKFKCRNTALIVRVLTRKYKIHNSFFPEIIMIIFINWCLRARIYVTLKIYCRPIK